MKTTTRGKVHMREEKESGVSHSKGKRRKKREERKPGEL
jgi:hypothetical protein